MDLLWKDGLTTAAVRLEMLWNQLARTQDFSLLCGCDVRGRRRGAAQLGRCQVGSDDQLERITRTPTPGFRVYSGRPLEGPC